ncbi:hypothetical protein PDN41_30240 [Bacillus cereus]|nr:hypothetical protein [Bacillus cereus]
MCEQSLFAVVPHPSANEQFPFSTRLPSKEHSPILPATSQTSGGAGGPVDPVLPVGLLMSVGPDGKVKGRIGGRVVQLTLDLMQLHVSFHVN